MINAESEVDALVLCGDKGASKLVCQESKAFLILHGKPLFVHVLDALEDVERVRRIFIVGDKNKLEHFLQKRTVAPVSPKPVITLEQWNSLVSNIWNGFLAMLDGYEPFDEEKNPEINNRVIFILPGDCPLISSVEINEFFDGADMTMYDHCVGLTRKEALVKYYPTWEKPGMKMTYFYFREGAYRINNLHMARPLKCGNRQAIQQVYNSRYQKDIKNIIRLTRDMWVNHVKLHSLAIYFLMQLSMFLAYIRLTPLNNIVRRFTPMDSVTAAVSRIMGMRFGFVTTDRGGAALDVDNESDYGVIKQRFKEWKEM